MCVSRVHVPSASQNKGLLNTHNLRLPGTSVGYIYRIDFLEKYRSIELSTWFAKAGRRKKEPLSRGNEVSLVQTDMRGTTAAAVYWIQVGMEHGYRIRCVFGGLN